MLAFIVGRKSGFAMLFVRLIAVMVYTMAIVLIIRFHDGQYLKESSSMTILADGSQKKNTAVETRRKVRLLCWLLSDPGILPQAVDARDTWMQACDIRLFMSSEENKEFPAIGLNVSSGRNHIAEKSKAAWTYVYENHRNDADFFMKADPDSYIAVENLKRYLANCDPDEPAIYGHNLYYGKGVHYVAGEAVVLGRESLIRLVTKGMLHRNCYLPGQAEDLKTSYCLSKVGGYTVDTKDENGRETFLPPFPVRDLANLRLPDWYTGPYREPYGYCEGVDCLSDYPIAFHYVISREFYVLDYLLRKRHIQFQSSSSDDVPQFRFNGTRYIISSNYTIKKGSLLWLAE